MASRRRRGYGSVELAGELLTTPDPGVDRTIADRYRLVRLVGSGGMGSVFEAEDLRLGRPCAVKVLRDELAGRTNARRRFDREASLLGRLVHENIVALLDVGVAADGRAYLVLEYLRGRTLRAELQQAGVRSVGRTLEIVRQVARGLSYAHAEGVIHRDLKPENILLTAHADGRLLVKLLDFGIARQRDGSGEPITATDTGIGTAAYMAPEQARGERALDATTDVYALGAIVYEALAGRRPYDGGSYNETLFQILNHSHKPLAEMRPDLALRLCAAVERALAKSPKARFESVRELAAALGIDEGAVGSPPDEAGVLGSGEATAAPDEDDWPNATRPATSPVPVWRFVASGLAGAGLGALALAALSRAASSEPPPPAPVASAHSEVATLAASARPGPAVLAAASAAPTPALTPALVALGPSARAPAASPPRVQAAAPRTSLRAVPDHAARSAGASELSSGAQTETHGPPAKGSADVGAAWAAPSGYIADSPYASRSQAKREP